MTEKQKLQERRHKLALDARAILNDAQEENRNLSADESTKFDNIMADVDAIDKQIERMAKLDDVDSRGIELEPMAANPVKTPEEPANDYRTAFMQYLRRGKNSLNSEEVRALEAGVVAEGGALTYEEFERRIVEKLNETNVLRGLATVISTGGDRNIPVEDGEGTATWISEEGTYAESLDGSSNPEDTFSRVVLGAHKLQYLVKVSEELLYDSAFDLEGYLARMIGRRLGDGEEAAFVAGNGTGKPTGVMTSATVGKTAASGTALTADEIIDLYHSVKRPYRMNATWLMNDDTIKVIRKFKDTTDQYLWQPGLQAGEPDRILARPVAASTAAPTIALSAKVIAFGDMSYYWIADRGNRVLQRLNELYAGSGQVGFRAYERVDGKIVLSEAIKALQMAAA